MKWNNTRLSFPFDRSPGHFAFLQVPDRFEGSDLHYEVERSTEFVTWTKVVAISPGQTIFRGAGNPLLR